MNFEVNEKGFYGDLAEPLFPRCCIRMLRNYETII